MAELADYNQLDTYTSPSPPGIYEKPDLERLKSQRSGKSSVKNKALICCCQKHTGLTTSATFYNCSEFIFRNMHDCECVSMLPAAFCLALG